MVRFCFTIDVQKPDESPELIKNLYTRDVRLHYRSDFIDFNKKRNIVLETCKHQDLFDKAVYVATGHLITYDNGILMLSFGGLIGEFKPSETAVNESLISDKWLMYIY